MRKTDKIRSDDRLTQPSIRSIWIGLIVTSAICLSTWFACAAPFAALATLAGLKLGRGGALSVMGLVWLINQAIGYGLLDYPRTWDSAAWGLAIGAAAALATLSARSISKTRAAPLTVSLSFVAAFTVFELVLYVVGLELPGSAAAFDPSVVGYVFLINVGALCCLMAVYQLAVIIGLDARVDACEPFAGSNRSRSW